jgi:hypothetical protein
MNIEDTCQFDKNESCYAYVCYSSQKCNARDKNGNPCYATLEEIKAEDERNKKEKNNGSNN